MSTKYLNKYRSESARLKNWDYRKNAAYFITICTHNKNHYFGEMIMNNGIASTKKIQLSEIGKLANQYWLDIPIHFPFIKLGAFVVMPHHLHGVLIIDKNIVGTEQCSVPTIHEHCTAPTLRESTKNEFMSNISPKPGSISTIIRSYKSVVSKHAHQINADFKWQTRFHDHIIRDSISFNRIKNYIENNPLNWDEK